MLEARLLASSPEAVFEELKKLSAKTLANRWWNSLGDAYEVSLVNRNERLINLGLAAYGTNKEVLSALYKHALEPAQDTSDASYKEGLRIGCLSNRTAPEAHWISHFPDEIIGADETRNSDKELADETRRLLAQANDNEAKALIQNPKVSEDLLEALFKRAGPFADLPERRWQSLVWISGSNARLVTRYHTLDGSDMGHYRIHRSIFELLEIAPVTYGWLRTLYRLLDQLDFQQVHRPDGIARVLGRWAQLPTSEEGDSSTEGDYTTLPLRDEFRCFIAALYGRGFAKGNTILHGNPDADDIAVRCAYYARGRLTAKDMEVGYNKDRDVFTFAAILNSSVHGPNDLRQLMEDKYLDGAAEKLGASIHGTGRLEHRLIRGRWAKYDKQYRKRLGEPAQVSPKLMAETTTKSLDAVRASVTEVQKGLATLTMRVSELRSLIVVAAIFLAILIYFRFK